MGIAAQRNLHIDGVAKIFVQRPRQAVSDMISQRVTDVDLLSLDG
jgi:hypothetical protein